MNCAPYPSVQQATDCARLGFEIYRSGQIMERRAEFGCCAWTIQGYSQKLVLGDPDEPDLPPPPMGSNMDAEDALEALADGKDLPVGGLPWKSIASFFLKLLLEKLL